EPLGPEERAAGPHVVDERAGLGRGVVDRGAMGASSTGSSAASGTGGGAPQGTPYVYVGGYGNLIHVFRLGLADGTLTAIGAPVDAGTNPSFLAVDPAHRTLLAVNEAGGGSGAVASFRIDAATGAIAFVSRKSSQGDGPAHVSTDHAGAFALVANY